MYKIGKQNVPLYSTGNYIQYTLKNDNQKEYIYSYSIYIYVYM